MVLLLLPPQTSAFGVYTALEFRNIVAQRSRTYRNSSYFVFIANLSTLQKSFHRMKYFHCASISPRNRKLIRASCIHLLDAVFWQSFAISLSVIREKRITVSLPCVSLSEAYKYLMSGTILRE
ncbi:hypothetical protein Zmor_024878 [Zophobas morio]|uniref:Uncharacterized protein n=1 Tax=Zophobas morio TaxID=2755281 RepID=A0AA38HQC9_9CUCU|nr:hypothetical protein Zmor_024878 [Zophobas morio]